MKGTLIIARKEIFHYSVSPATYFIFVAFLLILSFFFFNLLAAFQLELHRYSAVAGTGAIDPPNLNQWVIEPFFQTEALLFVFIIPLLTMRTIADERRRGTLEFLLTSPLRPGEFVGGKFIGAAMLVALLVLLSGIYPGLLCIYGNPEVGPILSALLGLLLYGAGFAAIGVAASAWTKSQALAGMVGMAFCLLLYAAHGPSESLQGWWVEVLQYASPRLHLSRFVQGAISISSLVFFLSVLAIGLFFARQALNALRWR